MGTYVHTSLNSFSLITYTCIIILKIKYLTRVRKWLMVGKYVLNILFHNMIQIDPQIIFKLH